MIGERTRKIDFVIAWVDGSDPAHVAARRQFRREDEEAHAHAVDESRFYESGEIYYLIASILKYAPFVRRVYIITDNQKPRLLDSFVEAGLCEPSFLELVSHDTIFQGLEAARPIFNSRAIEASMWRIPGLSEQFVYCNDDMFLNSSISPSDLFRNGKPVLYGDIVKPSRHRLKMRMRGLAGRLFGWKDKRPKHRTSQEIGATLAGMKDDFLYTYHYPHPLRRSVIEKFYQDNLDVLHRQVKFRFRNVAQYTPVALSNNLEMAAGDAIIEKLASTVFMLPEKINRQSEMLSLVREGKALFGCVQSLEQFPRAMRAEIHKTLREKFSETLPLSVQQFSREAD